MDPRELKLAVSVVWHLLSVALLAVVLAAFLLPRTLVERWTPRCSARQLHGTECPLCGMTTAFLRIGAADWTGAWSANWSSVPLFVGFCTNAVVCLTVTSRKWVRLRQKDVPTARRTAERVAVSHPSRQEAHNASA